MTRPFLVGRHAGTPLETRGLAQKATDASFRTNWESASYADHPGSTGPRQPATDTLRVALAPDISSVDDTTTAELLDLAKTAVGAEHELAAEQSHDTLPGCRAARAVISPDVRRVHATPLFR
jgi:hypothetical protein